MRLKKRPAKKSAASKKVATKKRPATGPRTKAKAGPSMGPIEHVVLIVKENHCFDNYFGTFPNANGMILARSPNPPPHDPDHRHGAWLTRQTTAVRQQFVEQDIPAYFAYARQFTLCDNYFTDVAGPSTPNHLMLIAADSPIIDNPPRYRLPIGAPLFPLPSLPMSLEKTKLTWRNYGGYAFSFIQDLYRKPQLNLSSSRSTRLRGTSRLCRGSTPRTMPANIRPTRTIEGETR